jgi:hypothetical protein
MTSEYYKVANEALFLLINAACLIGNHYTSMSKCASAFSQKLNKHYRTQTTYIYIYTITE